MRLYTEPWDNGERITLEITKAEQESVSFDRVYRLFIDKFAEWGDISGRLAILAVLAMKIEEQEPVQSMVETKG